MRIISRVAAARTKRPNQMERRGVLSVTGIFLGFLAKTGQPVEM